jgi:hypothetical protein
VSDREELEALRRLSELEAKAGPPKKARSLPGDMGSMSSSAAAYGAVGDALESAAYSAGGWISDKASKFTSPENAGALGYGANVALQALPAVFGGQVAKTMLSPLMKGAGQRMMQSALKPPIKERKSGEAAEAIDTLLNDSVRGNMLPGASLTHGQVTKLHDEIDRLGSAVKADIGSSSATIQKGDVGKRLLGTLEQFKNQVNPNADMAALKNSWLEFRNHPDLIGKTEIPVQKAHSLKQGTYRSLGDKPYGELQGASVESQKQIARALREEVAGAVPSAAVNLKQQSRMINAADLADRRVMTAGNNNLLGLAPLGVTPLSWLMFLADRSPATVSTLARMSHSGSNAIPGLLGSSAGGLYGNQVMGNPNLLYREEK